MQGEPPSNAGPFSLLNCLTKDTQPIKFSFIKCFTNYTFSENITDVYKDIPFGFDTEFGLGFGGDKSFTISKCTFGVPYYSCTPVLIHRSFYVIIHVLMCNNLCIYLCSCLS